MPQKAKKRGQKNTVCFTVELEKKTLHRTIFLAKFSYVRVLLIDGGAVKKTLGHSTKKKTNPTTGTTFSNFSDKVAVP